MTWNGRRLILALVLVAGGFAISRPIARAQSGSVTVTVRCQPNPEQITVNNRGGAPLTVQRIESSGGAKVAGEPIDVVSKLPAAAVVADNQTIIYENGPNAAGNVLLPVEIFDDANLGSEDLILTTDRGTFRLPCGSGTNTQTFAVGPAAVASPTPGSPGVFRPPSPGDIGGAVGTAEARAQATAASAIQPAQQTAQSAAATVSQASAPVQAIANTVTAPAQATIAAAAQSGANQVGGVVAPVANTPPGLPPAFAPAQATVVVTATPTPGGPPTFTPTPSSTPTVVAGAAPAQAGGLPPWILLPIGASLLGMSLFLRRRQSAT